MLQLELRKRPFWFLVALILKEGAREEQARKMLGVMQREYETHREVCKTDLRAMAWRLTSLGLKPDKARTIRAIAETWCWHKRPETAADISMLGLSRYVADSWAIFIENDLSVKPKNEELRAYLKSLKANNGVMLK